MKLLWMKPAEETEAPYIAVYRCRFSLQEKARLPIRFSADERAQLFLDGKLIADGPERGATEHWYFQDTVIEAEAGAHVLTARVTCFGFQKWAYAQLSIRHGLWIHDSSETLKNWDYQIESGCSFEAGFPDWGALPRVHLGQSHNSEILFGTGGVWSPVEYFEDTRTLFPPDLPLMRHEETFPEKKENGLYYFPHYACVWADYKFKGNGTVKIRWAETPYLDDFYDDRSLKGHKGNRDGSYFVGNFDTFEINGELHWFDYWWHAGHYVQIITEGEVTVEPRFFQTGYPFPEVKPQSKLEAMALETLQACSWETYMDCPYYEQLMYISDSRLEALCTYKITDDHRLAAKALRMFSLSQRADGSFASQYPSRSNQTIPSFMLIWYLMLQDYYRLHGDDDLVKEVRPRGEILLDFLLKNRDENGLLSVEGWNFIDWCDGWKSGVPTGAEKVNSVMNWFFVMALKAMSEMKFRSGLDQLAEELKQKIQEKFFDPSRNLYALDLEKKNFSEHSQILALLATGDTRVIPGLRNNDLTPCSISFSYYYLEACVKFGLEDLFQKRIARWIALQDEGLTTLPEEFVYPRSDCHAWSSHVLLFADKFRK